MRTLLEVQGAHLAAAGALENLGRFARNNRLAREFFCDAAPKSVLANIQAAAMAVGVPHMLLPLMMMIVRHVREWRSLHRR
jgi:hypothetical protein